MGEWMGLVSAVREGWILCKPFPEEVVSGLFFFGSDRIGVSEDQSE